MRLKKHILSFLCNNLILKGHPDLYAICGQEVTKSIAVEVEQKQQDAKIKEDTKKKKEETGNAQKSMY